MRFVPHTEQEKKEMLEAIGVKEMRELFADIPAEIQEKADLGDIGEGLSEHEVRKRLAELASKNVTCDDNISFLGAGTYDHHIPAFVDQLLLRSEFYTAYTPYQPEVSQGTLISIFEYQTLICELTGMELSNASVYDGATATAEAVLGCVRQTRRKKVVISDAVHPEYTATVNTYISGYDISIEKAPTEDGTTSFESASQIVDDKTAAIVIQYPNFFGNIEDLKKFADLAHENKALLIAVVADPVSLGVLKSPGELGADFVAGEGQSFGNNMYFGGPHLGFLATLHKYLRSLPGRIVGRTKDVDDKEGYVLTLQAREQHIRREKAGSNICTNQALCALGATMSLCAFGKQGLKEMACNSMQKAHYAKEKLSQISGVDPAFDKPFFKEFVLKLPKDADEVIGKLKDQGIFAGVPLNRFYEGQEDKLIVCVTELRTKEEIDTLAQKLEEVL